MISVRNQFQKFELILMSLGFSLFAVSLYFYMNENMLSKMLFGISDTTSEEIVGLLEKADGNVRRKKASQPDFQKIPRNIDLFNFDTIVTGPETSANLKFKDGSELELGPKTMVQLEFESNLTFGGFDRSTKVNIVTGRVKGRSKTKKLILKSAEKKTEVRVEEQPKVIEVKELTIKEAKVIAEELVKPEPIAPEVTEKPVAEVENLEVEKQKQAEEEAKRLEEQKLAEEEAKRLEEEKLAKEKKIAEVKNIEIEKLAEKKKTPLKLKLKGIKPNQLVSLKPQGSKVKHNLNMSWQSNVKDVEYETVLYKNGKEIADRDVASKGKTASLNYEIDSPGNYELLIRSKKSKLARKTEVRVPFKMKKDIQAINLKAPLIAGSETASNTYTGEILQDFDITLQWQALDDLKEYKVNFFKAKEDQKPFMVRKSKDPNVTLNQKKVFKGKVFYQVVAKHPKGFTLRSPKKPFRFDFLPPVPKYPKHKTQVTKAEIDAEKGEMLFTWQKTNFTDYYEIEVAQDTRFKKNVIKRKTKENFSAIPIRKKGTYWWRVRSHGQGVYSPHTPTFRFQIK